MCELVYDGFPYAKCKYLQSFYSSNDDSELRIIFSDYVSNSLSNGKIHIKLFLKPNLLLNAIDLDFLSCALTAESFGDQKNKNGILKQRDKALKSF